MVSLLWLLIEIELAAPESLNKTVSFKGSGDFLSEIEASS